MHLVEALVAGSVFAIASGSSLQIWSATALRTQQLSVRERLEQMVDQDQLQLQLLWRSTLVGAAAPTSSPTLQSGGCARTAAELLALGSAQPVAAGLVREMGIRSDGEAIVVRWHASANPRVRRDRSMTPAGLGLCGLPTDHRPLNGEAEEASP